MRYQIAIRWPADKDARWALRAHGARHDEAEAKEVQEFLGSQGWQIILLPLPDSD